MSVSNKKSTLLILLEMLCSENPSSIKLWPSFASTLHAGMTLPLQYIYVSTVILHFFFFTKSNWEELLVYRDALALSQRKQKKKSNHPLKQLQCQCSDSVKSDTFNKIRIFKTLQYKAKHSDDIFVELTKDRHLTFWPYSKNLVSLWGEKKHE